jgi:hypothetical protein
MARRLVTAIAGERALRPFAATLLLLLAAAAILVGPALAEDADEAFSATVKVDATADSAAAAREAARIDGQRRALAALIERLSGSSETKPPKLDDKTITGMVDSFEVANERMSAVRYIADYTFHFRPSKVRRLVRVVDSTPAEPGSKSAADSAGKTPPPDSGNRPIVVLPVYKDGASLNLWDDPNGWRAAWAQRSAGTGPARLTLPLGDAKDLAAIDAEKAESAKPEALTSIAQRNGASEAVVALATARHQDDRLAGLEVSVKRYRYGHLIDTQGNSFDADPGESETDFLRRAASAVAADIEKKNTGARSDPPVTLAATVPIASLGEWLQVRERLGSVPTIRKIDLLSLNRQEARLEIKYVGGQDQLKSSLAEVNLDLGGDGPVWRIQLSGATSAR